MTASNRATLKTAIGIADMFPPLYRRAIVEAIKHGNQRGKKYYPCHYISLHWDYFGWVFCWRDTKEGYLYWAKFQKWWMEPEKYPFPKPHPSWEHRFPREWKQYHGELPYEF